MAGSWLISVICVAVFCIVWLDKCDARKYNSNVEKVDYQYGLGDRQYSDNVDNLDRGSYHPPSRYPPRGRIRKRPRPRRRKRPYRVVGAKSRCSFKRKIVKQPIHRKSDPEFRRSIFDNSKPIRHRSNKRNLLGQHLAQQHPNFYYYRNLPRQPTNYVLQSRFGDQQGEKESPQFRITMHPYQPETNPQAASQTHWKPISGQSDPFKNYKIVIREYSPSNYPAPIMNQKRISGIIPGNNPKPSGLMTSLDSHKIIHPLPFELHHKNSRPPQEILPKEAHHYDDDGRRKPVTSAPVNNEPDLDSKIYKNFTQTSSPSSFHVNIPSNSGHRHRNQLPLTDENTKEGLAGDDHLSDVTSFVRIKDNAKKHHFIGRPTTSSTSTPPVGVVYVTPEPYNRNWSTIFAEPLQSDHAQKMMLASGFLNLSHGYNEEEYRNSILGEKVAEAEASKQQQPIYPNRGNEFYKTVTIAPNKLWVVLPKSFEAHQRNGISGPENDRHHHHRVGRPKNISSKIPAEFRLPKIL